MKINLLELRIFLIGLGIINFTFGLSISAYFELFGNILVCLGVISFCSAIIIWIHQQPTKPKEELKK